MQKNVEWVEKSWGNSAASSQIPIAKKRLQHLTVSICLSGPTQSRVSSATFCVATRVKRGILDYGAANIRRRLLDRQVAKPQFPPPLALATRAKAAAHCRAKRNEGLPKKAQATGAGALAKVPVGLAAWSVADVDPLHQLSASDAHRLA